METETIWRMTCSTTAGVGHRRLYRLPEGARLEHGICWWVCVNGDPVRCAEPGCLRAMRAVAVVDSHRGTRDRKDCGPRCTGAIGPDCDCKCRGQNHGV